MIIPSPLGGGGDEIIPDNNNNTYSLLSFLIFGFIGGTLGLLVADYYYHDYVSNIPVIGSFVDSITSGFNYVKSYFYGGNITEQSPAPPDRGGWEVIRAEVISRSSSGGSDITITPALITPPSTPEPGINPWD